MTEDQREKSLYAVSSSSTDPPHGAMRGHWADTCSSPRSNELWEECKTQSATEMDPARRKGPSILLCYNGHVDEGS